MPTADEDGMGDGEGGEGGRDNKDGGSAQQSFMNLSGSVQNTRSAADRRPVKVTPSL